MLTRAPEHIRPEQIHTQTRARTNTRKHKSTRTHEDTRGHTRGHEDTHTNFNIHTCTKTRTRHEDARRRTRRHHDAAMVPNGVRPHREVANDRGSNNRAIGKMRARPIGKKGAGHRPPPLAPTRRVVRSHPTYVAPVQHGVKRSALLGVLIDGRRPRDRTIHTREPISFKRSNHSPQPRAMWLFNLSDGATS
jgi:hypothetical protein